MKQYKHILAGIWNFFIEFVHQVIINPFCDHSSAHSMSHVTNLPLEVFESFALKEQMYFIVSVIFYDITIFVTRINKINASACFGTVNLHIYLRNFCR